MTTTMEKTAEGQAVRGEDLVAMFGGTMEGWDFTGEVAMGNPRTDRCLCGHPVRWMFPWKQIATGRIQNVGLNCLQCIPFINKETMERIAKAVALAKEKQAAYMKHLAFVRKQSVQPKIRAIRRKTIRKGNIGRPLGPKTKIFERVLHSKQLQSLIGRLVQDAVRWERKLS